MARLHLLDRSFLGGHCHGRSFGDRQANARHRAVHRAQAIRRQLGGSATLLEPPPPTA
ncbi:MAG TPA: hypothetical protein VNN74_01215 [Candidatus Micrarchaeia archaeon]|nr:hypothetical protein [Candidatus Micrarchaeia archaeon]